MPFTDLFLNLFALASGELRLVDLAFDAGDFLGTLLDSIRVFDGDQMRNALGLIRFIVRLFL